MNIELLKQKLADIDAATLQDFILDLYLHYPQLSDRIEVLVIFNDPDSLAKALGKRIQSLRRGRRFIDYRGSFDFSRELDALLADIESRLLATSPKYAFDLVDKFLATAESVLNRVDDSGGAVGEVYRQAVLLWLKAAKGWQDAKVDWPERIYQLYQQNDYGVLDPLLPNAQILLTQTQLKQLAWRYESELRKALKSPEQQDNFNYAALCSGVALGSIARALRDPALYERSILIRSPQPNNLLMKDICENFLQYQQPEAAMRYLNQAWESRFEHDRLLLLDKVYMQTGDRQQLKQIRYQLFLIQQSHDSFKRYLETLDEEEKADAYDEAIENAEQGSNLLRSVELLLNLGQADRAQALLLSRHQELSECFYDDLLRLAKALEKADYDLAATACYRALLLDILLKARSKAYGHGARYFKKLEALAGRIKAFKPLPEHYAFVQQLQSAHGRKESFWTRLQS
jgi:dsDNA-binding SOS-regulon protein